MSLFFRTFYFISAVLFLSGPLFSEVLYLKNGNIVIGKIISQSRSEVVVLTDSGQRLTQEKTGIRKIAYSLSMEDEERIRNQQLIDQMRQKREQLEAQLVSSGEERKETREHLDSLSEEETEFFEGELAYLIEKKHEEIIIQSAFLPGLGQFSKNEIWKTSMIGGLFLTSIGGAYYANNLYNESQAKYQQENLQFLLLAYNSHSLPLTLYYYQNVNGYRSDMSFASSTFVTAGSLAAIIYLLSMSDAWFFEPDPDPEWGGSASLDHFYVSTYSQPRWSSFREDFKLASFGWTVVF